MKIKLKRIFLIILSIFGHILCFKKRGIRILFYHSVNPYRKYETNVIPEEFEKHIRYLKGNFEVISLIEAIKRIKNKSISGKEVVITFDDGYRDNYLYAYPVLQKYGLPATIFLTVGYVGKNKVLPHDIGDNPEYNRILNWEDIKKMECSSIIFGSHTLNHVNLSKISFEKAKEEITLSYRILKENLKNSFIPFSYPYGTFLDFNSEIKKIVKEAGYFCACSAIYGVNNERTDLFSLYRIGIDSSDNFFTFKAKINGYLDFLSFKDVWLIKKFIRSLLC